MVELESRKGDDIFGVVGSGLTTSSSLRHFLTREHEMSVVSEHVINQVNDDYECHSSTSLLL